MVTNRAVASGAMRPRQTGLSHTWTRVMPERTEGQQMKLTPLGTVLGIPTLPA